MKNAAHDDSPVLITAAAPSGDDQYASRKRKYITMMLMRIPCLILAGIFAQQVWWLAVIFVVISIPLPWIAVLIANDRPPRKKEHVHSFRGSPDAMGELEQRRHEIIDG